jgi:hypothetical protein
MVHGHGRSAARGLAPAALTLVVALAAGAGGLAGPSGAATLAASGGAATTATTGLVAAYSFDAGGGTTVADSSGRGNTGTLRAATWTAAGKYGRALSFNGTNSWMSVNDAPSLDLAGAMTLEAWVKPTGTLGSTARAVLVKERAGGRVYGLYANDAAARPKGVTFVGGVEQVTEGAATLPLGTWTHLAATYDGAALKLYVNGVPVSATAVPGAMPASTGPLRIGGDGVGGEWFSGTIDEVRVYNRALTPAQIEATMSARIP